MAFKSVEECVEFALTKPLSQFRATLKNELKDYMAHEIMKHGNSVVKEHSTLDPVQVEFVLMTFHNRVFGESDENT